MRAAGARGGRGRVGREVMGEVAECGACCDCVRVCLAVGAWVERERGRQWVERGGRHLACHDVALLGLLMMAKRAEPPRSPRPP